jgi:phosphate-selective porin
MRTSEAPPQTGEHVEPVKTSRYARRLATAGRIAIAAAMMAIAAARAGAQDGPSPEPAFELSPRGYVQLDWRGYPDWPVATGTGRLNHEPFEVRRARVGVDGRWQRVSFEVTIDPQDEDGVIAKDAYAQVRFSRALRLRLGQFKLPGSREYGRSARSIDFMERAAVADTMAAGRDIGGMATGDLGDRLSYEAGLFLGDGNGRVARAGTTGAGRAEFALHDDLEIGGSLSIGRTAGIDTEDPNGLVGRSASGYRFFDQVYVNGVRTRAGLDAGWERGPWRVDGEFMRVDEQRLEQGLDFEDLPRLVGTGWSAAMTRAFGRRQGRDRVRWREIELAFRLDGVSFDDSGPQTGNDSVRARATDVRPRSVLASTVGVSWQPTPWTRVMTNASSERYSETRSGPEPGHSAFLTLGMRLQVELP